METGGWFSYSGSGSMKPVDDAYTRFSNPERFGPLHEWALEAVAQLRRDHEVNVEEGRGMDPELERAPLSRATLKLTPFRDDCAPITIAFTASPGLEVRVGRWVTDVFSSCGCDACDEMPEEEFERFTEMVSDVVAGRFRESLSLLADGDGWSTREFWCADGGIHHSGGSRMSPFKTSQILGGEMEIVLEWMPWQPKSGASRTP